MERVRAEVPCLERGGSVGGWEVGGEREDGGVEGVGGEESSVGSWESHAGLAGLVDGRREKGEGRDRRRGARSTSDLLLTRTECFCALLRLRSCFFGFVNRSTNLLRGLFTLRQQILPSFSARDGED